MHLGKRRSGVHTAQEAGGHHARPHWGKMHDYDADRLRQVYPRFDDFLALRGRHDPARVFANPYLEQVLGAWSENRRGRRAAVSGPAVRTR